MEALTDELRDILLEDEIYKNIGCNFFKEE